MPPPLPNLPFPVLHLHRPLLSRPHHSSSFPSLPLLSRPAGFGLPHLFSSSPPRSFTSRLHFCLLPPHICCGGGALLWRWKCASFSSSDSPIHAVTANITTATAAIPSQQDVDLSEELYSVFFFLSREAPPCDPIPRGSQNINIKHYQTGHQEPQLQLVVICTFYWWRDRHYFFPFYWTSHLSSFYSVIPDIFKTICSNFL